MNDKSPDVARIPLSRYRNESFRVVCKTAIPYQQLKEQIFLPIVYFRIFALWNIEDGHAENNPSGIEAIKQEDIYMKNKAIYDVKVKAKNETK